MDRTRPPVIDPGPERPAVAPRSDAIVLFDGKSLAEGQSENGTPAKWVVGDGSFEVAPHPGPIVTKRAFGDIQLQVEWAAPGPATGEGQDRGNSGVFLMTHYKMQGLDSYHSDTYADVQAAAMYCQTPPLLNALLSSGQWKTLYPLLRRTPFPADTTVRYSP